MLGAVILMVWLLLAPLCIGKAMTGSRWAAPKVDNYGHHPLFWWISGQFLLWALFQLLCVPIILLDERLTRFLEAWDRPLFFAFTDLYAAAVILLVIAALLIERFRNRNQKAALPIIRGFSAEQTKITKLLWMVFWLLLLFQLVQAVTMAYADGDDAFYVAVSTLTEESGTMYHKLPYTGGTTELDVRHGLAPFPIWIAFLARISGISSVVVAHIVMPLMLIPMTYGIYGLIGRKLFDAQKLPVFLIFTELLVLFGDYSIYTVETFMIARSRQGKAALGSIVIPMAFLIFFVLLERFKEKKKVEWLWWLLLLSVVMTGCLCSTLGAVLLCMLTAVVGLCAAVCNRKWDILVPMALCCIPAVCFAVIYLISG